MTAHARQEIRRVTRLGNTNSCCPPPNTPVDREAVRENAQLLAALADPTRLQIVELLAGSNEPVCVCEIVCHFELGQPTISHHLKALREARLVEWEKRGLWVYYSLNRARLGEVASYIVGLLSRR